VTSFVLLGLLLSTSLPMPALAQVAAARADPARTGIEPKTISIADPEGAITADSYGMADRAVVLLHGGRFDRTSWRPQASVLAARGFRVLALDFRASVASRAGKETPCLYDPACLAKDVLAAVRFLKAEGAKQIAVVGGSLGGGAAAQAAIEAGEGEIDRVVLLAHMSIPKPEGIRGRKLFVAARGEGP
jgi:pimeloyl-ACP methyl ester carboxylesterase